MSGACIVAIVHLVAEARTFYPAAEYSFARQACEGAAVMRMVLLEGV